MSDMQMVAKLIEDAGSKFVFLEYQKKSGEMSKGLFHPKCIKHCRGGEDSTAHLDYYINMYNIAKKRYAKIDLRSITKARINGKTYNFS